VSTATVSRVLNSNYPVATATREKVLATVRELDYVVNGPARSLAASTSDVVGVLVNDIADPFFSLIARGVQRAAARAGLLVSISTTEGDRAREATFLEHLRRQRARAAILVGGASEDLAEAAKLTLQARALVAQGGKVVACGRPPMTGVDPIGVTFDNRGGLRAMTAHMTSLGHRDITYLAGPESNTTTAERLAGFRQGVRDPDVRVTELHSAFTRQAGYETTMALLARGLTSTALVAANDLLAAGALAALRDRGVRVPEEVSVVGCDDQPVCADTTPSLTTVRLPLEEAGARAAALAIGAAESDLLSFVTLPYEIVIRESATRAPQ
jgi:LacI family transcriptional regulator